MVRRTRRTARTRRNQRGGKPLHPNEIPKGLVRGAVNTFTLTNKRLDEIHARAYYYAFYNFIEGNTIEQITLEIMDSEKDKGYNTTKYDVKHAIEAGISAGIAEYHRKHKTS